VSTAAAAAAAARKRSAGSTSPATVVELKRQLLGPSGAALRREAAGRMLADILLRYGALPPPSSFLDMLAERTTFLRVELPPVRDALRGCDIPHVADQLNDIYATLLAEYRALKAQLERFRPSAPLPAAVTSAAPMVA